MFGTLVVYAGLVTVVAGLVSLIRPLRFLGVRTRKAARGVALAGLGLVALGMVLPAGLKRAAAPESLLDRWMPEWQFEEWHALRVRATPEQAWRAIHEVTANEIFLFRTLTTIRNPRWLWSEPAPEDILNPPREQPIVEVAMKGGFRLLASEAPREVVLGTVVLHDKVTPVSDAESLRRLLTQPGNAVATINFRVHDEGGGWVRVATETRVYATDDAARRRFARYWRLIYPGSSLLRYTWLRAIRARAERKADAGATASAATNPTAAQGARLLYAISAGEQGRWQPTGTEIFALDAESGESRKIFSDAGKDFLLLLPMRSGGIPQTVAVATGQRVFVHGIARSRLAGGYPADSGALYEIAGDGTQAAREVCKVQGQQRTPRNVFVSPAGDKVGYINDVNARWQVFVHETASGKLLWQIALEPILQDGFVRNIGWLPDGKRIFFTGETGDEHVTSEESYRQVGSHVMKEDGSEAQPIADEVDGATRRAGFQALENTPPTMLGALPDGRYLFAELQFASGARSARTFYYAADPASKTRTDISLESEAAAGSIFWSKLAARGGRMLAFTSVDRGTRERDGVGGRFADGETAPGDDLRDQADELPTSEHHRMAGGVAADAVAKA